MKPGRDQGTRCPASATASGWRLLGTRFGEHALPGGHLSVAVEPHGEPLRVVEALRPIVAKLRNAVQVKG
jgi:hypothetical protein